mmetsp:Transcript_91507/g.144584  ORF Transcript_91507/g.144584 Transcript_91507/m.144584 type:complete len:577 (+) Transcript_91507:126-1856(+)
MAAFYSQPAVVPIGYGQGWSQVPSQFPTQQYAWPQGQMLYDPSQFGQTSMAGWTPVPCQTGFAHQAGMYEAPTNGQMSLPYTPQQQQHDPVDLLLIELGVQPHEDINFAWIAEYALQSEVLAPRWAMHSDAATGRVYYVDNALGNTSWENPLSACLRQVIDVGRSFLLKTPDEAAEAEDFFSEQKDVLWELRKKELECWHGPFDNGQGRCYYSNSASGVSSWQDPREEMQFMYELETKLLDALAETLEPLGPDVLPSFGFGMSDDPEPGVRREGGAEIMTLDSQEPDSSGKARNQEVDEEDHKSVFESMVKTADYMYFLHRDEEEVQHLMMSRKAKDRRMRMRRVVEEEERKLRQDEALREAVAAAREETKAEIIREMKEQQQKEEEARQLRIEKEEAARKEQERIEEEQRQKELAEREAEAEALRLKEEKRLEERQKLLSCIEHAIASRKLENMRTALADGKSAGLDSELEPLRVVMEEVLIASVEDICKCHDVTAMQAALADYEAFNMQSEADKVRKALEEELSNRKAVADKARKAKEELAAQFKDAQEAKDFGGAILAAQWRAAVREISKPNP